MLFEGRYLPSPAITLLARPPPLLDAPGCEAAEEVPAINVALLQGRAMFNWP